MSLEYCFVSVISSIGSRNTGSHQAVKRQALQVTVYVRLCLTPFPVFKPAATKTLTELSKPQESNTGSVVSQVKIYACATAGVKECYARDSEALTNPMLPCAGNLYLATAFCQRPASLGLRARKITRLSRLSPSRKDGDGAKAGSSGN